MLLALSKDIPSNLEVFTSLLGIPKRSQFFFFGGRYRLKLDILLVFLLLGFIRSGNDLCCHSLDPANQNMQWDITVCFCLQVKPELTTTELTQPSVHGQGSLLQSETEMGSNLTSSWTGRHPKMGFQPNSLGVLGVPLELPKPSQSKFASPDFHPKKVSMDGSSNES